jgi:hypothetical protein
MKSKQLQVRNEVEALLAEQAVLLARELEQTCTEAADGQVLDQAEGVILAKGRDLLRLALQASLQRHAATAEKRGRRGGNVPAADSGKAKGTAREVS